MEKGRLYFAGTEVNYGILRDQNGSWLQFWYSVVPQEVRPIEQQLSEIANAESQLYVKFGLVPDNVAIRRFFSSDLISHAAAFAAYKDSQKEDFYCSLTDQTAAQSAKAVLLAMALPNIIKKERKDDIFFFETKSGVKHIFVQGLVDPDASDAIDAERQTTTIFELLRQKLASFGATTANNVLRTWIYAPNVDADYPGIVRARKRHFDEINLTAQTHYIASTGIQGGTGKQFARVSMDVYAVTSPSAPKVRYLSAPSFLGPTHLYGVTFERATSVELGETDFLFISGTASIDPQGNVVHPGDVIKQTERTLENISALLAAGDYTVDDLSSLIIYLRDPTDFKFVKPVVERITGSIPAIYVKAAVCRPGWLVEIEATAAKLGANK